MFKISATLPYINWLGYFVATHVFLKGNTVVFGHCLVAGIAGTVTQKLLLKRELPFSQTMKWTMVAAGVYATCQMYLE